MNDARPAPFRVTSELEQTRGPQVTAAGLPMMNRAERRAWLAALKVGDLVACYFGEQQMGTEVVTSAPRTLITTGRFRRKVNYRRDDGYMTSKKPLSHWFHIERPS